MRLLLKIKVGWYDCGVEGEMRISLEAHSEQILEVVALEDIYRGGI